MSPAGNRPAFFRKHWYDIAHPSAGGIARHLDDERDYAHKFFAEHGYRSVIEGGCADGSYHLPAAVELGLPCLGVEIVPEAAAACRERVPEAQVRTGDVERLDELGWQTSAPGLLVLPFNLFGNLARPDVAAGTAHRLGLDLLVLGYRTDQPARDARDVYYRACGFSGTWSDGADAVTFTTPGWTSYAFRPHRVGALLHVAGYRDIAFAEFGDLGLAAHATR
jgi:hypothetical protein